MHIVYLTDKENYESAMAVKRALGSPGPGTPEDLFYCHLFCAIEDFEAVVDLLDGYPCGRCAACRAGRRGMCTNKQPIQSAE